jgi:hypothetical protein
MTFEFNYDPESEEISIIYDNYAPLKVYQDNGKLRYLNFEKIEDEDIENLLKNLCKNTFDVLT